MNVLFCFLLFLFQSASTSESIPRVEYSHSTTDRLGKLDVSTIDGWRFSPNDDPSFSSVEIDDSEWFSLQKSFREPGAIPDSLWKGFGWFRCTFVADETLAKSATILTLDPRMNPVEIYLDGRLLIADGTPSQRPEDERLSERKLNYRRTVSFQPEGTHVLAMRLSFHSFWTIRGLIPQRHSSPYDVILNLSSLESVADAEKYFLIQNQVLAVFALAVLGMVMLLHMVLYYRDKTDFSNLALALLCATLFTAVICVIISNSTHIGSIAFEVVRVQIFNLANKMAICMVPWICHIVLNEKPHVLWKAFMWVPVGVAVYNYVFPEVISGISTNIYLLMVAVPGGIVALYKAKKKGVEEISIVTAAILAFPLIYILYLIMTRLIGDLHPIIPQILVFLFLTSVPVGLSIFQGRKFLRLHNEMDVLVKERTVELQDSNHQLERSMDNLKSTQSQLIHAEKMASLGELTAGIAHEIQNPLNFVNNFSELSSELVDEMVEELEKGETEEAKAIGSDIKQNLEKINHHGKRADAIVKGMLAHSRTGKGEKELTDINQLADEYLRLSYHGLRAKDPSFNADFKTDFDPNLPKINVIPQDIGRVLLNLINNAFQACTERSPTMHFERSREVHSAPLVTISTKLIRHGRQAANSQQPIANSQVLIAITDNGPGIPDNIKDKIFQPFFTTKPTGQGTGLGLSLSYDIIKAHNGNITVKSSPELGTTFTINLDTI